MFLEIWRIYMKKSLSTYKLPLLIMINTNPFALNVMFYSIGCMDEIYLFLPIFAALTTLNYYFCNKTAHYVIIQIYLLVCSISSGCISTYLYYKNVSSDPMTPAVGMLLVFWGAVIVIITTIITGIIKRNKSR